MVATLTTKLWNREGKLLHSFEKYVFFDNIADIDWSPDGKTIALASANGILFWNTQDERFAVFSTPNTSSLIQLAWNPNGQTIATSDIDGTIKLWDTKRESVYSLEGHGDIQNSDDPEDGNEILTGLTWSPDGKILASSSYADGLVKLWNRQGKPLNSLEVSTTYVSEIAWSPDSKILAAISHEDLISNEDKVNNLESVSETGVVNLWSREGKLINYIKANEDRIDEIKWSPDGKTLATITGSEETIKLWDRKGQLLDSFGTHTDGISRTASDLVSEIAWSPDGKTLASISKNRKSKNDRVKLWNFEGKLRRFIEINTSNVENPSMVWSPNSRNLALLGKRSTWGDEIAELWDMNGKLIDFYRIDDRIDDFDMYNSSINIYSEPFAYVGWDRFDNDNHDVKFWSVKGELLDTFEIDNTFFPATWTPNGKKFANIDSDGIVKIWSVRGKVLYFYSFKIDCCNGVSKMALNSDGKTLAIARSGYYDSLNDVSKQKIELWSRKGKLLHSKERLVSDLNIFDGRTIAWSPDGKILAIVVRDQIELWSKKGKLLRILNAHINGVKGLVWNPDSNVLASLDGNETINLWSLEEGLLHSFKTDIPNPGSRKYSNIIWSPNGKIMAVSDYYGGVKLWNLSLESQFARGCDWARDYLTNNPNVSEEDRKICDGIE